MGFGFNLTFIFVLVPVSGIFLLMWLTSGKKIFGQILGVIWAGVIGLVIIVSILQMFTTKNGIKKSDIYGEYVVDRSKFPGPQADWQYAHYRFEVTPDNQFIFHQTKGKKIIKSDTIYVDFNETHFNHLMRINKDSTRHHIIVDNPTLYRKTWSFYYVFYSKQYGNVFFKKGKWK